MFLCPMDPHVMLLFSVYAWTALVLAGTARAQDGCPVGCSCLHSGSVVDCTQAKLKSIPSPLPTSAQVLILDNNRLDHVPAKVFANLTRLSQLSLQNCNLTSISEDALYGLESLSTLTLAYNNLKELPADLIKAKDKLTYISLSHNPITLKALSPALAGLSQMYAMELKYIEAGVDEGLPDVFANMTSLKILVLDYNTLTLTDTFFTALSNGSLENLSLMKTNIANVSSASMNPLTELRTLDLSGSYVFPEDVSRLLQGLTNATDLHTLNMNHVFNVEGTALPKDFFEPLSEMRVRNLSFCGNNKAFEAGTMPHRMFSPAHSLQFINLDRCALHVIPTNAFNHLSHLHNLSLSQNQLTCFRKEDCGFLHNDYANLLVLDLSWNNIQSTGGAVKFRGSTFPALDRLNLRGNKMTILKKDSFKNLPISHLDLSENPIGNIEQGWMDGLTELKYLYLNASYRLNSIGPKSFHGARRLQYLHLEQGSLMAVHPAAFKGLHRLNTLRLRDNVLTDDSLVGVHIESANISVLDLGHNSLTSVPVFVSKLDTLEELFLDMNYINDTGSMSELKSLKVLDLSYNLLTNISLSFFQVVLPKLTEATFEYNPFYCGCEFENIKDVLSKSGVTIYNRHNHICHSPPDMRGINIFDVRPSNWHCNVKHAMVPFLCVLCTCLVGGILVLLLARKPRCSVPEVEWPVHCCTNCYSQLKQSMDGTDYSEDQSGL